jgi:hypothetical protein
MDIQDAIMAGTSGREEGEKKGWGGPYIVCMYKMFIMKPF